MTHANAKTTETSDTSTASRTLRARLTLAQGEMKARAAAAELRARAQVAALPGQLKTRVVTTLGLVREKLDLPTRADLAALATRLDALDHKLAEYETTPSSKARKPKAD